MSAELQQHYETILGGITDDRSPEANDFGWTKEESELWMADMAATREKTDELIAVNNRINEQLASIEEKLLLPPTASELKDLLDHIAQRHGFADAQEVINAASQAIAA